MMEFTGDLGGFEEILGAGRWSTVYRCPSKSHSASQPPISSNLLTPPPSPTFKSSSDVYSSSKQPDYYAVKVAENRSSIPVLRHEASILSHLSSIHGHEDHTVPFHGFDARHNAIIFTAVPETLESFMSVHLSRLDEANRSEAIATLFLRLARSLTSSLAWLHAGGVTHADMKPANILLRPDLPIGPDQSISDVPFTPLLADFTAAYLKDSTSASTSALGGGTYDYLAPELLSHPFPAPSPSSDVYAMAITLLSLITGTSPFAAAGGNRYQLLAMIKAGMPLAFAMQDARSEKRLQSVAAQVKQQSGIDILHLLEMGLRKSSDRVSAAEWSSMF